MSYLKISKRCIYQEARTTTDPERQKYLALHGSNPTKLYLAANNNLALEAQLILANNKEIPTLLDTFLSNSALLPEAQLVIYNNICIKYYRSLYNELASNKWIKLLLLNSNLDADVLRQIIDNHSQVVFDFWTWYTDKIYVNVETQRIYYNYQLLK